MGYSLPNHDAKGWKGQTKKKTKKTSRVNCIRQGQSKKKKKKIVKNNLNDA